MQGRAFKTVTVNLSVHIHGILILSIPVQLIRFFELQSGFLRKA
jgi:hypothetical protein